MSPVNQLTINPSSFSTKTLQELTLADYDRLFLKLLVLCLKSLLFPYIQNPNEEAALEPLTYLDLFTLSITSTDFTMVSAVCTCNGLSDNLLRHPDNVLRV